MARLTNADLNNAMKEFRHSKGNDEFIEYFDRRSKLQKNKWYRFYRRKARKLWMSLPSL